MHIQRMAVTKPRYNQSLLRLTGGTAMQAHIDVEARAVVLKTVAVDEVTAWLA